MNIKYAIVFILLVLTTNSFCQHKKDLLILPEKGKLIYEFNGVLLTDTKAVYATLKANGHSAVQTHLMSYKKKNKTSDVFWGIGGGFLGIWLLNEFANKDFHSSNGKDVAWKSIVIGTTLSFSISAHLFRKSAKKELLLGVEQFNKQ